MSQKGRRSRKWDDAHLNGWLWPVKMVLRAFSSVTLAVITLSGIAIYGVLASVPIGMLAMLPTLLIYALVFILTLVAACVPVLILLRVLRNTSRTARVSVGILATLAMLAVGGVVYAAFILPVIRYDPLTQSGFRLFGNFVDAYRSTTLRRLPGVEMNELEFYAWWPMRTMLVIFVINMITATVRRIEFNFRNIGVLTVHTGIVAIALGSLYYSRMKVEGDMVLFSGPISENGVPSPGDIRDGFYDNTTVALWLNQGRLWEQRPLRGVPRYNDYALNAGLAPAVGGDDNGRSLDVRVPPGAGDTNGFGARVDEDLQFRIVGFASYCELESVWIDSGTVPPGPLAHRMPRWFLDLRGRPGALPNAPEESDPNIVQEIESFELMPTIPTERTGTYFGAVFVETAVGMPESRWKALADPIVPATGHALVVEIPDLGYRATHAVSTGQTLTLGQTGWTIKVDSLLPSPPFPIITAGYENAESSVALLNITPPADAGIAPFTRYCYHRFPAIDQDLSGTDPQTGRPLRSAPNPEVRVSYIDASVLQVYIDQTGDETLRTIVRPPLRGPVVRTDVTFADRLDMLEDLFWIEFKDRWQHARQVDLPNVTPAPDRRKDLIGTHANSAFAVEITSTRNAELRQVEWVPFNKYVQETNALGSLLRQVQINDGRRIVLGFGRIFHRIPGIAVQLEDFEMLPYPHSDLPRDYRADLIIHTEEGQQRASTSMNYPLQVTAPMAVGEGAPFFVKPIIAIMGTIAPNRFKFSQAGWDEAGWRQAQRETDAGLRERPAATFTILGVGNNPGIYIVAVGAVMISIGIPWAFYIKPLLVRRERDRIKRSLATRDTHGSENGTSKAAPKSNAALAEASRTESVQEAGIMKLPILSVIAVFLAACTAFAQQEGEGIAGNTHPRANSLSVNEVDNPFGQVLRATMTTTEKEAFAAKVNLEPLRDLAVFHAGRVKILDTLARESTATITGRTKYRDYEFPAEGKPRKIKYDPLFTYIDTCIDPDYYDSRLVLHVEFLPLREAFLELAFPGNKAEREKLKREGRLSPQVIRAHAEQVIREHQFDAPMRQGLAKLNAQSELLHYGYRNLLMVAPETSSAQWRHLVSLPADSATRVAFATLGQAWRAGDAATVNATVAEIAQTLPAINPDVYPGTRRELERIYNASSPFEYGYWMYLLAFITLLLAFGTGRRWLIATGVGLLLLAVALHGFGFGVRCVIAERFAIQNQYESMTGVSLFAALVGTVLMFARKQWLFGAAAAAVGFMVLVTATQAAIPGSSINREAAILNTSVLLKYHVTTVLTAYGLISLGMVVSLFYLVTYYGSKFRAPSMVGASTGGTAPPTELAHLSASALGLDDDEPTGIKRVLKDLDTAQMTVLQLAFWVLGVGVLLGAWWADHSWGRWWAFDPKELWALITWIVYLVVVHVRFGITGHRRALVTAWLSILGFAVMLWCYFGVNLLLPGLHAYA